MIAHYLWIYPMLTACCVRCVTDILMADDIGIKVVNRGEVILKNALTLAKRKKLRIALAELDLHLLECGPGLDVEKIKIYIHQWVNTPQTTNRKSLSEFLAEKFVCKYADIAAFFKNEVPIGIKKYCINYTIERVKIFLVIEHMTIEDIAVRLNYKNTSHLYKQFLAITGMTPQQYIANETSPKDTLA